MISTAVYGRYARSLVDVVLERGAEAGVKASLELYRSIFSAVPDLLDTFDNPAIPREVKEKLLSELFARYPIDQITENFLRILLTNNRIRHFHEIVEYYTRILNERKGILAAKVTSASGLSQEEARTLERRLAETLGRTISMTVDTDPSLLGGLVVQIGSTVYDGSIRTQLAEMKQRLMDPAVSA